MTEITVGRYPGTKPEFMNVLYDPKEKKILQGWEYESDADRNQKYRELRSDPEIKIGIKKKVIDVYKATVVDGEIQLIADWHQCPECKHDRLHKHH
jgi:hypothetical protein